MSDERLRELADDGERFVAGGVDTMLSASARGIGEMAGELLALRRAAAAGLRVRVAADSEMPRSRVDAARAETQQPWNLLEQFGQAVADINQVIAENTGERGVVRVIITDGTARRLGYSPGLAQMQFITSAGLVQVEVEPAK